MADFSATKSASVRRKSHRNRSVCMVDTLHNPSGQRREPGIEVVPAAFPEILPHEGSPVFAARLPAVAQNVFQTVADERSRVRQDRADHSLFKMRRDRRPAQLVAFESGRGRRSRMVHDAGGGMPDPHQRPIARRGVPFSPAGQSHDLPAVNDTVRRDLGVGKMIDGAVNGHARAQLRDGRSELRPGLNSVSSSRAMRGEQATGIHRLEKSVQLASTGNDVDPA